MKTDPDHLLEVIRQLGVPNQPATPAFRAWLDANKIPNELRSLLEGFCFKESVDLGVVYLGSFTQIMKYHETDPIIQGSGFLQIGSATNGDPVALDLTSGAAGYFDHDLVWDGGALDLRSNFRPLAPSLGTLARRAITDNTFPIDWHQANTTAADKVSISES